MQRRRLSNGDILPNNTISGNGPYYDINYGDGTGVPGHVHVGYTLYADHKEAGTGSLILVLGITFKTECNTKIQ